MHKFLRILLGFLCYQFESRISAGDGCWPKFAQRAQNGKALRSCDQLTVHRQTKRTLMEGSVKKDELSSMRITEDRFRRKPDHRLGTRILPSNRSYYFTPLLECASQSAKIQPCKMPT